MDEGCSKAVLEVFVRLYEEGLIYRGDRIIHWCPECKTALSDAEVEYEEQNGHLWHIYYPAEDGGEGVVVATTRPETMLGDTGVAVHPDDERYAHLVGKRVRLPLRERMIPVVADAYVEREFGTGAVKMTPAHDPNDFEVGLRHNLPIDRVMNDDGTMNEKCGKYEGMTALEARAAVVEDLRALGLLVKIEEHVHNVGTCYRCFHTVEPLVSRQWFVSMKPLAEPAVEAVKSGDIVFTPKRFEKTYMHWMENIRDWCISRQLWWGHRIPAWYCDDCGEVNVAKEAPHACKKCGSTKLRQDEDVLDTWFSSGLWPFSTMGWPEDADDLRRFYPTTTMYYGYEIIFFWVARMVMLGLHFMGERPFKDIVTHGIVRDGEGRKMSKSLGNGIDPLVAIERFGADALRYSLLQGVSPGNDIRYKGEEKLEAARNFANKIWNAARFAIMNLDGEKDASAPKSAADRWILSRMNTMIGEIAQHIEEYDSGLATQKLYDFIWSELCDWYLELAKSSLYGEDAKAAASTRDTLERVLTATLKLLHPFMPFLTEEIYDYMPGERGSLMMSDWPDPADFPVDEAAVAEMEAVMEVIRSVRNLRAEMGVPPSRKAKLWLKPAAGVENLLSGAPYMERLAGASAVELLSGDAPEGTASAVSAYAEAYMPLNELIDVDKERARLQKELDNAQNEVKRLSGKLGNPGFTGKAPANVVEGERQKLATAEQLKATLTARLEALR
jgi:valyl-tRNA synthetase